MKKLIHCISLTFTFLLFSTSVNATHYRAGQITYQHISGNTYEFTVITFFNSLSPATEQRIRIGFTISWGDNTSSIIPCIEVERLSDNYTKAIFRTRHTYPGPGVYSVIVDESVEISIKAIFRIDPNTGHHNSPQLLSGPTFKATLGERFVHNPSAFDADGDSLSYELVTPETSKNLYVDPITGALVWDAPTKTGAYFFAIRIIKWRFGVKISSIMYEMMINVYLGENMLTTSEVAITEKESIKVYPNPTTDMIHFRLDKISIVQLYDSLGRLILSHKYEPGDVMINISQQPAGIYFLKLENQTVKIVKVK